MRKKIINYHVIFKNDTICLSKHNDREEYWLYDKTQSSNLSMEALTANDAFAEAIIYYQKRMAKIESELKTLKSNVNNFIELMAGDEDN